MKKNIIGLLLFFLFAFAAHAQELKVMSYNIKSFETFDPATEFNVQIFADEIKKINPDIICIQELETHTSRMEMREVLTELGSLLGMYPLFGFSYVKDAGAKGLYGNGILSKYPIINSFTEQLAYRSGTGWSYDQRSYQWAEILVPAAGKEGGQVVRIINTHLDHRNQSPNYGQRKQHAEYIVSKALDGSTPTLLFGDMNEGPSSSAIAVFNEVFDRVCNNSGTFGGSKLDYIFSYPKTKWTVLDYKVYTTVNLSDHYPIMGTVKLN